MFDDAHRALINERLVLQRRQANTERVKMKPVVSTPTTTTKKRSPSKVNVGLRSPASFSSSNNNSSSSSSTRRTGTLAFPTPCMGASSPSSYSTTTATRTKKNASQLTRERHQAMVPCRYFSVNGQCPQGSSCPYSHHPDLLGIFGGGSGSHSSLLGGGNRGEDNRRQPGLPGADSVEERQRRHRGEGTNTHQNGGGGGTGGGDSLDIDRMDYDQLTALCDTMGKVKIGVEKAQLNAIPCVVVRTAISEKCSVCQEHFALGDCMKVLPCSHPFHPGCIDEWLDGSKKCPNCNEEIILEAEVGGRGGQPQQSRTRGAPPPTSAPFFSSSSYHPLPPPAAAGPPLAAGGTTSASGEVVLPISNNDHRRGTTLLATRPPLAFRNVHDVMAALEDCP